MPGLHNTELNDGDSELLDLASGGEDTGAALAPAGAPGAAEDRGDDFIPTDDEGAAPAANADDKPPADGAAPVAAAPAAPAGAGEDGGATNVGGARIPKARLDEVIGQRDALKEQLAETQRLLAEKNAAPAATDAAPAAAAAPAGPDLKALRAKHREAMMDGNMEEAEALDEQIDAAVFAKAEASALSRIEARMAEQQATTTLQQATTQALADYPYLDTEEGAEALDLIVLARDSKVSAGMAPAQALAEAVAKIAPRFAPTGGDPDKGLSPATAATDTRSVNALSRGAADSLLQPPAVQAGIGNRTSAGRVDVKNMDDDQFASIPDAEKKRLRGD